jgi:L-asparagine transporter-like permease
MIEWLLTPIDISRPHEIDFYVMWHSRLMMLAWGILIPLGVIICRFCKVTPKQDWPTKLDNQVWWHCHLTMQISAFILTIVALLIVFQYSQHTTYTHIHQPLGWAIIILVISQIIAGLLRGSKGGPTHPAPDGSWHGDHFDMSRRRVLFEYFHKTVGYILIYLSIASILSGMWHLNAPRWMWLVYTLWLVLLIAIYILLQKKGLAKDTYQAIWGPDPSLPGNQKKVIGLGVQQITPNSVDQSSDS